MPDCAATNTSMNPGPPSDCGAVISTSSLRPRRQPAAIAAAASGAVRLSPKQSGAISTRKTGAAARMLVIPAG
jgi:hypothetical protein